jgi:hypothetical protein
MNTDDQSYLQRKYKDVLPSRGELVAISIFGATSEEREAAKALLPIAPSDDEHPFLLLKRLYPNGSEAERMARESPAGRFIQDLIDSQPKEIVEVELPVTTTTIELVAPVASQALPVPEEPLPAVTDQLGDGMLRLTDQSDAPRSVVVRPRMVYAPMPTPEQDWGRQPI